MTLSKYLEGKGMSQRAFAKMSGVSTSHLSEIVLGRKVPGLLVAKTIVDATGGEVTFEDLVATCSGGASK